MMYRLFYFTLDINKNTPGVFNKIISKCRLFKENGLSCEWLNIDNVNKKIYRDQILVADFKSNKSILVSYFDNLPSDAIFLFRHHEFSSDIHNIFKKKIVVSEHNTIELSEWKQIYKNYTVKDWLYLLHSFEIFNVIRKFIFYNIIAKFWYKDFDGFVSVTKEIDKHERDLYYSKNTPSKVISNGVCNAYNVIPNQFLYDASKETVFIFLAGGDYLWNNFNRIADFVIKYPELNIKLHYYGSILPQKKIIHSNIDYYSEFKENTIAKLSINYNIIGIGTLGLFKKRLNEACPLKVRDYWAMGLPVILGYKDTDVISNDGLKKFVLEVPNDNSEISLEKIKNFIDSLKGYTRQDILDEISKISMDQKIKQYMNFIRLLSK